METQEEKYPRQPIPCMQCAPLKAFAARVQLSHLCTSTTHLAAERRQGVAIEAQECHRLSWRPQMESRDSADLHWCVHRLSKPEAQHRKMRASQRKDGSCKSCQVLEHFLRVHPLIGDLTPGQDLKGLQHPRLLNSSQHAGQSKQALGAAAAAIRSLVASLARDQALTRRTVQHLVKATPRLRVLCSQLLRGQLSWQPR